MAQVKIIAGDDEVRRMEREVDRFFKTLHISKNPLGLLSESVWQPPTDVFETCDEIVICMEIPSVRKEDISVLLVDDVLTIRGRRSDGCTKKKVRYLQMEVHYGYFERSFILPAHIDARAVHEATYSDGFLRVAIPKSSGSGGSKTINVKLGL